MPGYHTLEGEIKIELQKIDNQIQLEIWILVLAVERF
jgi:hypothetical protein